MQRENIPIPCGASLTSCAARFPKELEFSLRVAAKPKDICKLSADHGPPQVPRGPKGRAKQDALWAQMAKVRGR